MYILGYVQGGHVISVTSTPKALKKQTSWNIHFAYKCKGSLVRLEKSFEKRFSSGNRVS